MRSAAETFGCLGAVTESLLIYSLSPKRLLRQERTGDLDCFLEHILIRPATKGIGDLAILSNAYASNYVANLANFVAGFYSAIDPKSAIWNKGLQVTQIPGLTYTPTQMDALTFAKFNVLRSKGANVAPVLLHDRTAAIYNSDFTFVLRMNIHGLVIDTICQRADLCEGQSSLDGLQMTSMKSAMDEDMVTLQKRGYISKANIKISTTQAQQNSSQVLRQPILGAFVLWRSKRLAHGRGPGRSQGRS